ncbi:unnamed protein product [Oikopleura dioica]|uniref:Uncharacterized protein n=1 Tax=Oikopleura dioica TaxID=34765 RepID=E4XS73_OIKDI|nr:unnamed protein product [Oikopleura dioica]CBY12624.1 unnamed protein product [Oikopleura dioica]
MKEIDAISREFVHSGDACTSCGGFTRIHAKCTSEKTGAVRWKCVKCMYESSREAGSFSDNLKENPLEVTNGKFQCPAKKCSRFLTFEEFWKKDCCEDSRKHNQVFEEYLERKGKFNTLQAEYQRAMKNCLEKKKASENADIYRDAIGASMISTANSFADFLKSNEHIVRNSQLEFDREHMHLLKLYRKFRKTQEDA